jgi:hypothetical protein
MISFLNLLVRNTEKWEKKFFMKKLDKILNKGIKNSFGHIGLGGVGGNGGNKIRLLGDFDENDYRKGFFLFNLQNKNTLRDRTYDKPMSSCENFMIILKNNCVIPEKTLFDILPSIISKSNEKTLMNNIGRALNKWYSKNGYFSFVDMEKSYINSEKKEILLYFNEFRLNCVNFNGKVEDVGGKKFFIKLLDLTVGDHFKINTDRLVELKSLEFIKNPLIILNNFNSNSFESFLDMQIDVLKNKTLFVQPGVSVSNGNFVANLILSEKNIIGTRISIEGEGEVNYPKEIFVKTKLENIITRGDRIEHEYRKKDSNYEFLFLIKKNLSKKKPVYFNYLLQQKNRTILNSFKKKDFLKYQQYSVVFEKSLENFKKSTNRIFFCPRQDSGGSFGYLLNYIKNIQIKLIKKKKKKIFFKNQLKLYSSNNPRKTEPLDSVYNVEFLRKKSIFGFLAFEIVSTLNKRISFGVTLNMKIVKNDLFFLKREICVYFNIKNSLRILAKLNFDGKKKFALNLTNGEF